MDAEGNKEVKQEGVQSGTQVALRIGAFVVGTIVLLFLLKAITG